MPEHNALNFQILGDNAAVVMVWVGLLSVNDKLVITFVQTDGSFGFERL